MRIDVVPYDSSWPATFRSICSQLEGALASVDVISIEHIGSTSVPGLAAKPVIDVAIVVDSDAVRPAVKALEGSGYEFRGDLGIPDRYAFRAPEGAPRQSVYVTIDGCLSLRNQLGLRSVLRQDGHLRDRYGAQLPTACRRPRAFRQRAWPVSAIPVPGWLVSSAVLSNSGNDASRRPCPWPSCIVPWHAWRAL